MYIDLLYRPFAEIAVIFRNRLTVSELRTHWPPLTHLVTEAQYIRIAHENRISPQAQRLFLRLRPCLAVRVVHQHITGTLGQRIGKPCGTKHIQGVVLQVEVLQVVFQTV